MKLRNKLILSCAALAAVATTAVSTTFAWYTSNTQVSAKGATAESADSGNAMLMIANALDNSGSLITSVANLKFASSVTINGKVVNGAGENQDTLMPASFDGTGMQDQNNSIKESATRSGSYLHFALWFRNSGSTASTLTYKITKLVNNASSGADLPKQEILQGATGYTTLGGSDADDYAAGMTYGVDIVKALGMVVTEKAATLASGTLTPGAASDATVNNFDISDVATAVLDTDADLNVNEVDAARDYYNLVMGEKGLASGTVAKDDAEPFGASSGATQVTTKTVGGDNTYMLIDFMVYLNGWDEQCYDACQGQSFTMDLQFDLTA